MATTKGVEAAMRADLAARDDSCIGRLFYTEEEMVTRYHASRMTVRGAVERLVFDGMLRSEQGIGRTILRRHPRLTPVSQPTDPHDLDDDDLFDLADRVHAEVRRRWTARGKL